MAGNLGASAPTPRNWGHTHTVSKLTVHDHVSWQHHDLATWRTTLARFFATAPPTDRLIYTSPMSEEEMLEDLTALDGSAELDDGDGVSELLQSGRLLLISHPAPPADTEPTAGANEFKALIDQALTGPYTAVRVATRVRRQDLVDPDTGADLTPAFAAFEMYVDHLIATRPILALCGIDAALEASASDTVQLVHPLRRTRPSPGHLAGAEAWLYAIDAERWGLAGEVDLALREAVDRAIAALALNPHAQSAQHLELENLHFIDAAGMRALVKLAHTITPAQLVLHHSPPAVKQMLQNLWPLAPVMFLDPPPGIDPPRRPSGPTRTGG